MKYAFFLSLISMFVFSACGPGPVLERPFVEDRYKIDLTKMLKDPSVNNQDALLINYAIIRQRDFTGYTVDKKAYGEILEMAKGFGTNGYPVEQVFEKNGEQDIFTAKIDIEGSSLIQKKSNSKRRYKVLIFSSTFKNTTDQDEVLLSSTFAVEGPMQDHVMSVAYELNCLVKAGEELEVKFLLDADDIRKNLFFGKSFPSTYLGMEDLILMFNLKLAGISTQSDTEFFRECYHNGARIEPFVSTVANKDKADEPGYFETEKVGDTYRILYGPAHFKSKESVEPITIFK